MREDVGAGRDEEHEGGDAQVIVVGAGPGGSSAAYHLARFGVDVLLLEKSRFPREKVCGDGLTPRAVHQLVRMGIEVTGDGWMASRGVRMHCGDRRVEVDWPASGKFPDFGLTRTRRDFDDILARQAVRAGARLETGVKVTDPVLDRAGRITGVRAVAGPDKRPVTYRAPLVVSADGVSGRIALAMGAQRDTTRPLAVAARRYYRSPALTRSEYLDFRADVPNPGSDRVLPGYGWIFPLGDGRVNVGLGGFPNGPAGSLDLRGALDLWLSGTPEEWNLRDESAADGPVLSAALPMGFSRTPHYFRGLLLVGDSGGMVNPLTGEGIAHAMEAGELAAESAAVALGRPHGPRREQALDHYAREMHRRLGGYYRLGNAIASTIFTRHGFRPLLNRYTMGSPVVMQVMIRMMGLLTDEPGRDGVDRFVNALIRLSPAPRRRIRPHG